MEPVDCSHSQQVPKGSLVKTCQTSDPTGVEIQCQHAIDIVKVKPIRALYNHLNKRSREENKNLTA